MDHHIMRFRRMNNVLGYIMSMVYYCVKRRATSMNSMIPLKNAREDTA